MLKIRVATELTVSEIIRKHLATDAEVSEFREQCLQFLVASTKTLFERSPLGSSNVKNTRYMDPKHFDSKNATGSMKLLLKCLTFLQVIPVNTGDKALLQFLAFIQTCLRTEPEKIQVF